MFLYLYLTVLQWKIQSISKIPYLLPPKLVLKFTNPSHSEKQYSRNQSYTNLMVFKYLLGAIWQQPTKLATITFLLPSPLNVLCNFKVNHCIFSGLHFSLHMIPWLPILYISVKWTMNEISINKVLFTMLQYIYIATSQWSICQTEKTNNFVNNEYFTNATSTANIWWYNRSRLVEQLKFWVTSFKFVRTSIDYRHYLFQIRINMNSCESTRFGSTIQLQF